MTMYTDDDDSSFDSSVTEDSSSLDLEQIVIKIIKFICKDVATRDFPALRGKISKIL